MKLKFGAIVTDGRGKIGGHVASKNRAGAYLRTKVTPINPNTVAQKQARGVLASLSQSWSHLDDGQRQGWNDAVKEWGTTDIFGDIKNPSGINLFVKLNANLISAGFSTLLEVPAKVDAPATYLTDAVLSTSTGVLTLILSDTSAHGLVGVVRSTPKLSSGVSFVKSQFRVIGHNQVVDDVLSLNGAYQAKFGTPTIGSNMYVSLQLVLSNGQKTVEQKIKARVVS